MSAQAQFILIVNQDKVEELQKLLPGVVFAQVFAHDIGLEKMILLSSPKPVVASEDIAMPEALERAIEEAVDLPVEDMDVVAAE